MTGSRVSSEYILQGAYAQGACCIPIAMVNALVWWGFEHPRPGDGEAWEHLVELSKCRHGPAIRPDKAADFLNLVQHEISEGTFRESLVPLPLMLRVKDPKYGRHAVLMVGQRQDRVELVNWEGTPFTWVEKKDIEFFTRGRGKESLVWLVPRYGLEKSGLGRRFLR